MKSNFYNLKIKNPYAYLRYDYPGGDRRLKGYPIRNASFTQDIITYKNAIDQGLKCYSLMGFNVIGNKWKMPSLLSLNHILHDPRIIQ